MLLGAGYGTRLRPLTELRPKPLVPVGNRPLLDWHLDALSELGIGSVALNASHFADQIESHVAERAQRSPRVELIREETPLGTGGGLLGARRVLEQEACFLVMNTDIFHAVDLEGVLAAHDRRGADATLVVRRPGPDEPWDEMTVDRDGVVTESSAKEDVANRWRFTGIHLLSPEAFDHLSAPGSLLAAYRSLLAAGAKIMAHDCGDATWFDIGTPADYLGANLAAAQSDLGIEESAEIGAGCSIGPGVVIGAGASIGAGSRLSDSVVWPGVSIPADTTLHRCIAYPGGVLEVPDLE